MAWIEKVDEVDGEYYGGVMYGYRRDCIQTHPKNRKLFKGRPHVLVYYHVEDSLEANGYSISVFTEPGRCRLRDVVPEVAYFKKRSKIPKQKLRRVREGKVRWSDVVWEHSYVAPEARYMSEYYYVLYVPSLPGRVDGEYVMWGNSRSKIERKLKRIVGGKLNVVSRMGIRNSTDGKYEDVAYLDRLLASFYDTKPVC